MNYQQVINKMLCDIEELKTSNATTIQLLAFGVSRTLQVKSINLTGTSVDVSELNGDVTVDISVRQSDCDNCLRFDADRPITRNIAGLLGINLGTQGLIATLEELFYPYLAPSVVMLLPLETIEEKQSGTTNILVSATSTKNSLPITSFKFFQNAFEIYNVAIPVPTGENKFFLYASTNTDATPLTPYLLDYKATVGDGTSTSDSNIQTRTLVYPFFAGVGPTGLTEPQMLALTKYIEVMGDKNISFSPTNEKMYFITPAIYGLLTEINDGFINVTADFTPTLMNFTMLDGQLVPYYVYESINLETLVGYNLNFVF